MTGDTVFFKVLLFLVAAYMVGQAIQSNKNECEDMKTICVKNELDHNECPLISIRYRDKDGNEVEYKPERADEYGR